MSAPPTTSDWEEPETMPTCSYCGGRTEFWQVSNGVEYRTCTECGRKTGVDVEP
jgi:rRNA maturation protein Nop10